MQSFEGLNQRDWSIRTKARLLEQQEVTNPPLNFQTEQTKSFLDLPEVTAMPAHTVEPIFLGASHTLKFRITSGRYQSLQ